MAMWFLSLHLLISIAMLASCSELDRFPDKLSIVERTGSISLACKAPASTEVTWKLDGESFPPGRELTLENVDQPDAGNYTCWQNGTMVNHTYLVISEKDQSPIFSNTIRCRDRTFNGNIICSWQTRSAAVFKLTYYRRIPDSSCRYLDYSNSGTNHIYNFTVDNYSPYAEEYSPYIFVVEAINSASYQKQQVVLHVENIVIPDPPQNITVTQVGNNTWNVSWLYPCTWIEPYSYFPLHFEMEYKLKKAYGKSVTRVQIDGLSKLIEPSPAAKVRRVRIKAKDRFLSSPWSEWSEWIYSKRKKKGKKTKIKSLHPSRRHH
ncbi:interleukin-12 subunit beta-like [Stegostoma tigrinum]|uniref:interleukin-12 subunit beta-like n=1 Tax=Stegostoma tigrinum TaxID=3053191 RepID=UPI002870AB5E|nr:interleukin-12 subunit beta-like [Stegostoma tigrinum]